MIPKSAAHKYYHSATQRFLGPALNEFFRRELPKHFGPLMRDRLVQEIMAIVNSLKADQQTLEPGQLLWYALDKHTRADNPNRRLRPVILTLVAIEDCKRLAKGTPMKKIASEAIARIMKEAYQQGALLSMRDIELLTWHSKGSLCRFRQYYENNHQTSLPHTGTLHDMGSCISHKAMIVRKIILEKKDPRFVAQETNHTLEAVEHYVKDYRRVEQCFLHNPDPQYISIVTAIAKYVVLEYIDIIHSLQ